MATNHVKRALEILQERGAIELSKRSMKFLFRNLLRPLDPHRFKFHTWKNYLQNRIKYDAVRDPYNTIYINPENVSYRLSGVSKLKHPHRFGIGQIRSGDWDHPNHLQSVDEVPKIKGMIQRFEEEKPWCQTVYYKHYSDKYRKNNKYEELGYDSLSEYLQDIFNGYDNIYQSIKANGYIEGHDGSRGRPDNSHPVRDQLEILVAIGRNGNIFLWEGNHRFGIARALEIEIPANVAFRHTKWQELRDEIHNNGFPKDREDLRQHPDLQDILRSCVAHC